MVEPWLLPVDFPAYLEAKIEVDDQSLNPRLLEQVFRHVRGLRPPRLLDVGTGTGAMLRRFLARLPGDRAFRGPRRAGPPELVGLDIERRSLEVASRRIGRDMGDRGFGVTARAEEDGFVIEAAQSAGGSPALRVRLLRGGLLDSGLAGRLEPGAFDLVTAHAFLDLLPLEPALGAIRGLLRPAGWLYATINYDGLTAMLPPYDEPELERRLLERYELSMERRCEGGRESTGRGSGGRATVDRGSGGRATVDRADDRASGGRWSGRRLCVSLPACGYSILAVGASDWVVFPGRAGHSESRRVFLRALLSFMATEALAGGEPALPAVQRWYRRRLEEVDAGVLALMTHQLDVLAARER